MEMIIIQLLLAVGFIVSALAHLVSLADLYQLPRSLASVLHFGSAAGIFASMYISRQTRQGLKIADFKEIMRKACPHWLEVLTGLTVLYAVFGMFFFIMHKYSATMPAPGNAPARYLMGHWPALFIVAYTIVDSCRRFLNEEDNNAHNQ
jgi:hypothetical protein